MAAIAFGVRNHFAEDSVTAPAQVVSATVPQEATNKILTPTPHRPRPSLPSSFNFSSQRVPSQANDLTKVPHPGLPKGYKIVQDVFAVKSTKAKDIKEKKIAEARGYIFFHSEGNPIQGANVVIDEAREKLYPLSSVVKLSKVNEGLRNDLLSRGFSEHFYHEELQIMYLQSSHVEVFNLFDELTRLGLKPEFEILRGNHRSK